MLNIGLCNECCWLTNQQSQTPGFLSIFFYGSPNFRQPKALCFRAVCQSVWILLIRKLQNAWREFIDIWWRYGLWYDNERIRFCDENFVLEPKLHDKTRQNFCHSNLLGAVSSLSKLEVQRSKGMVTTWQNMIKTSSGATTPFKVPDRNFCQSKRLRVEHFLKFEAKGKLPYMAKYGQTYIFGSRTTMFMEKTYWAGFKHSWKFEGQKWRSPRSWSTRQQFCQLKSPIGAVLNISENLRSNGQRSPYGQI